MRTRISQLFLWLLLLASVAGAQSRNENRWIERLKKTSVSRLDPALSSSRKPFGEWFAEQVKPSPVRYEVNDCGERNGTPEERGKEFPLCVAVKADAGNGERVQLVFVVGTYVVPQKPDAQTVEKPSRVDLMYGSIGPGEARNQKPERSIRKLGELISMLRPAS